MSNSRGLALLTALPAGVIIAPPMTQFKEGGEGGGGSNTLSSVSCVLSRAQTARRSADGQRFLPSEAKAAG